MGNRGRKMSMEQLQEAIYNDFIAITSDAINFA